MFAYLESMHAQLRHYSAKRPLTMVKCGAGSCYLSMVVFYYYTVLMGRTVTIHCLDIDERLMEKAEATVRRLSLEGMHFHGGSIEAFRPEGEIDVVYSLHAGDTAADLRIAPGWPGTRAVSFRSPAASTA